MILEESPHWIVRGLIHARVAVHHSICDYQWSLRLVCFSKERKHILNTLERFLFGCIHMNIIPSANYITIHYVLSLSHDLLLSLYSLLIANCNTSRNSCSWLIPHKQHRLALCSTSTLLSYNPYCTAVLYSVGVALF